MPRLQALRPPPLRGPLVALLLLAGCTIVYHKVEVAEVTPGEAPVTLQSPVRAYLADGSVVVLPGGARVVGGELSGAGTRHTLTLESHAPFQRVSMDSVVALEAFRGETERELVTVLLAAAGVAGTILGGAVLLVAIFGSCPTIYGAVDGELVLQSEPFSYSIAPLFEARDVDRLAVRENEDGIVWLELRNEALETHYINHVELLEVRHRRGEEVLSDPTGQPLILGELAPPASARDRDGRDALQEILHADGVSFRSSPDRLAGATVADFVDFLELEFPVPPGADRVALALRARSTLLNTVLFYDVMLGEAGLRAVDWLGSDLDRIGTAVELGSWYLDRTGLRVEVEGEAGFELVEHLPDPGPIAWTERLVVVPVQGEWARVRLSFVSDSWFIDRVAVAEAVREPEVRRIPLGRVLDPRGDPHPSAVAALGAPDEEYFVTFPGDRFRLEFPVPEAAPETTRTFLLATRGYYVEWIRGDWLKRASTDTPFRPDDAAILEAMRRWAVVMEDFERDFHGSRIPVR
jgi:hypothetical protein